MKTLIVMDIPPPFPTFIFLTLMTIISSVKLLAAERQTHIPPLLPAHVIWNLITTIVALLSIIPNRRAGILAQIFGHIGNRRNVVDMHGLLRMNKRDFWYVTGETPESFDAIVQKIGVDVTLPRHTPRIPTTNRRRACKLDVSNRVLMVIIWLRHYLKLYVPASIFGVSKSTVAEEIYHVVPIIFICYRSFIRWHSLREVEE